jgi:predicted ATPase
MGELVQTSRLVTLAGAPGIGKTRLALHVAMALLDFFPDGVWLVKLAALSDTALVVPTVAEVLGLREQPGRLLATALVGHLGERSMLLVLDNCEHVLPACVDLIGLLLKECPRLHVLATSRQSLGIVGETVYRVPSLVESEAVQLFTERTSTILPGFVSTARNARDIARVCRRLDGIPLAIELAAARLRVLSPEQLLERLEDRLRLYTYADVMLVQWNPLH